MLEIERLTKTEASKQDAIDEMSRSKAMDEFRRSQARLYRAKADKEEMERDKRRGELVEVDDVSLLVSSVVALTRNRLLAIPSKWAPRMIGLKNAALAKDLLETAVNEAIKELNETDIEEILPEQFEEPR